MPPLNERLSEPRSESPLQELRRTIDAIDDRILAMVEERLTAAKKVVGLKSAAAPGLLKYRPSRETEVVGRLTRQAKATPPLLVNQLWRALMSHALQTQVAMRIVVCAPKNRVAIFEECRARFGPAAPIEWVEQPAAALEAARRGEVVAVIEAHLPAHLSDGDSIRHFMTLQSASGGPLAYAFGRVAPEDVDPSLRDSHDDESHAVSASWTPHDWRLKPAAQMPEYPDAGAAKRVERRLASSPPLVSIADIQHLKAQLGQVSAGRSFLLQGGDCAESFAEFGADKVRTTFNLLLQMGAMIQAESGTPVVHLARIAGQFAKPRSSTMETKGEITLPSYRGDAVNGPDFTSGSRTPDPKRLLEAHRQAEVTIQLLSAYAAASYADLGRIHREAGISEPLKPVSMFTSHEALLLNYEEAFTRFDPATESWWTTTGHFLWLGDRTRSVDGAHVEFARGIANPIGLKCGPSLQPDDLHRLMDILDPDNQPGRLVLIGRFGAGKVEAHLPGLMAVTKARGSKAIWSIDPMHGNTRSVGAVKTRMLPDIVSEIEAFFAIARSEGVYPGGVHLEMTGGDVTECLGGSSPHAEGDLHRRYL
ncbi:MAG: 3-deoxy-7-phosphoheptulonate synthase, partial [Sphingomicrobium sp.]